MIDFLTSLYYYTSVLKKQIISCQPILNITQKLHYQKQTPETTRKVIDYFEPSFKSVSYNLNLACVMRPRSPDVTETGSAKVAPPISLSSLSFSISFSLLPFTFTNSFLARTLTGWTSLFYTTLKYIPILIYLTILV